MNKKEFKAMYSRLRTIKTLEKRDTYWIKLGVSLGAHSVVVCLLNNYATPPRRLASWERASNFRLRSTD